MNGFWMVWGKKDQSVAPWPMPCPSFLLQKASKAIAFFVRKVVKAFKLVALVFIQPLHSLKQHTGTSSRHRQPQPLELLLRQPPPLESASIFEAARFAVCTATAYGVLYYVLGRALPSMPLVFQCTYTTIRSGSLGCVLTAQGCTEGSRAVRQSGSRFWPNQPAFAT